MALPPSLLLLSLLAAAQAPERTAIVVLELEVSGVESAQAELVNGSVAQALSDFDTLQVVTTGDIRRVANLEAQKQALGCDQESCLAEIAGALGAQFVIFGRLGRLDETVVVQLNLFDAEAARPVAREEVRAATLDELLDRVRPATLRLTRTLLPAGTVIVDEPPAEVGPSPVALGLRWGGAGVAGLSALAGAVAGTLAVVNLENVADRTADPKARNDGKLLGQVLVISSAAGGVLTLAGAGAFGASFLVE